MATEEIEQFVTQPISEVVMSRMPTGSSGCGAPPAPPSPGSSAGGAPIRSATGGWSRALSMVRDRLPAGVDAADGADGRAAGLIMHMGVSGGGVRWRCANMSTGCACRLLALDGIAQVCRSAARSAPSASPRSRGDEPARHLAATNRC
ncbi:MAG: hypothetical protein U1E53_00795 [Dongiaceae bacterium]